MKKLMIALTGLCLIAAVVFGVVSMGSGAPAENVVPLAGREPVRLDSISMWSKSGLWVP